MKVDGIQNHVEDAYQNLSHYERLNEFIPCNQHQFIMAQTHWTFAFILEVTYEHSEVHFSPVTYR